MRLLMRLFLLAGTVSLVLVAASVACSSASPATETVDAGKDSGKKPVEEETPPIELPPVEQAPVVDSDAGDDDDGGSTSGGPIGTTGDAGSACEATSLRESEPNEEAAPNALTVGKTFSFCGQVKQGETDVFTFTTPPFDNNFQVNPTGNVRIQGTVGAKAFDSQNGGLNFGNIGDGDKWVVKISTGSAATRDYRINFVFN